METVKTEKTIEFIPDQKFWRRWRESKHDLLKAGFRVFKRGEHWVGTQRIWVEETIQEIPVNFPDLKFPDNLRGYQISSVQRLVYAIGKHGSALDCSDTGTGKTYSALGTAKNLGLPVFVICPIPAFPGWKRALELTGVECLGLVNYEKLKSKKQTWIDLQGRKINLQKCLVIYDEAHKLKNHDTKNSEIARLFKELNFPLLFASATLLDKASQLRTLAYCLGLLDSQSWTSFLQSLGVTYIPDNFSGSYMESPDTFLILNRKLFGEIRATRVRKSDLPEQFQKPIIEPILVDFDDEVKRAYDELAESIQEYEILEKKADGLVKTLRARQKCELAKVNWFVDSAKEFQLEGLSVLIFVNFRETGEAIAKQLRCGFIYGDIDREERERLRLEFQENKSHFLVLTSATGGASIDLHDLNGRQRISLISPTWSAQELVQIFGRTDRDGSQSASISKIVFASGTIEENVYETVLGKVENITSLNDGDLKSWK